jgi:hypothetical protein
MSDEDGESTRGRSGTEAWGAISAFEQILEVMPNDISALDALVQSYEIVGDSERAREYLLRLARVLVEQGNASQAEVLVDRLRRLGKRDAEAEALIRDIEALSRLVVPDPSRRPTIDLQPDPSISSAIEAELALAWRLHSAGLLTQEEYAGVVNDLSETAARRELLTVSVLHVLQDRSFRALDTVIAYMAHESRTPVIPVASFEMQESCLSLLPLDFMVRHGAIPFDFVAQEALVAVLNPFDANLRERVALRSGRPCHFYLTWPAEFDAWIARLKQTR